ncbi:uncharacterized protein PODANS_7_6010 [Podospora anserina S mat+]|uniref:Podospora anserina S mat+ genomic DNA chromosome 7, supercontig 1 n=1 Tax=Podospora anserina (strain S / ATCC MYA-4624 / DSM 980 / FGSC 10383) TaxID=515849 RepID=B2AW56_PODAN|nr:uncharacterized protein PODANS_7_6010 [Podospora anserina S mat+]CAP68630.1 unnamed protein product [Podospora anserina S mat+]CDP32103.1 Putative protein of unknown function [Podospora anserina S mat+]
MGIALTSDTPLCAFTSFFSPDPLFRIGIVPHRHQNPVRIQRGMPHVSIGMPNQVFPRTEIQQWSHRLWSRMCRSCNGPIFQSAHCDGSLLAEVRCLITLMCHHQI